MAAQPLNRIVLAARSVADDLSYVALADIAGALNPRTSEYRMKARRSSANSSTAETAQASRHCSLRA
jgi:hypothetical protein